MKWQFKISLLIISIGLFVAVLVYSGNNRIEKKEFAETEYLKIAYFSEQQFRQSVRLADSLVADFPSAEIKGGIIPHDLRHAEYIAHFFSNLRNRSPKTIVLIGPNHKELGSSKLITASGNWSTPFGVLESDKEIVDGIMAKGLASEDKFVIGQEHSIYGIVPFIAYYLPETKIVPLIFKSKFSILDIENLVDSFREILPEPVTIVAAVDFSHYLASYQAEEKDRVTARALQEFDYKKILTFGENFNDYVDSPPSIAFLILWMKNNNAKIEILANTNSGKLEHRENEPVTSYFEAVYY